jgi:hypothetical protein
VEANKLSRVAEDNGTGIPHVFISESRKIYKITGATRFAMTSPRSRHMNADGRKSCGQRSLHCLQMPQDTVFEVMRLNVLDLILASLSNWLGVSDPLK